MNKKQFRRANLLANSLIPRAETLIIQEAVDNETLGECLYGLIKYDKEFDAKFLQLVSETKQRFQKEFDEL